MNAQRKKTANQSAARLRQSIGRLRHRLGVLIATIDGDPQSNLSDLDERLGKIHDAFDGNGFTTCAPDGASVDDLADTMEDVATALDLRHAEAKTNAVTAEERLRAHVEMS